MKSNPNKDFELSELIIESLNGTITDEQSAYLNRVIKEDPDVADMYLDFISVHTVLNRHGCGYMNSLGAGTASAPEDVIGFLEELTEYEKNGKAVEVERVEEKTEKMLTKEKQEAKIRAFIAEERAMEAEERRLEVEARHKIRQRELQRRQRAQKAREAVTKVRRYLRNAAMAALLMVIGYLLYIIMQPVQPAFVATLTDGIDVTWSDSAQSTEPGSPLRPGYMKLDEGVAEITFDEGACVIIVGPAEINLESSNRAFLQFGSLRASVPTQARGFKIDTPSSSIVDIGTEFGLHVAEDGSSDIHVFKGQVSLMASRVGRTVNKLGEAVAQIVLAGQAKRVRAGSSKIDDITFSQSGFVHDMAMPYELAVRRSNPFTYWRFNREQKQNGEALQYVGNAKSALIGPALGDGKANDALKLDGKDSYVLVKDKAGDWTQSGFSMVLWVCPGTMARQNIIVNGDQEGPYSNYSRQLFLNSEGKFTFWMLVWDRDLPEDYYPVTLTSSTVAQPGEWYHVAVTVAVNGEIRIFVNGSEENNVLLADEILDFKPERDRIYIGSSACSDKDDRKLMRSFTGGIDEIARYNRALSPQRIRQLYSCTITEYTK